MLREVVPKPKTRPQQIDFVLSSLRVGVNPIEWYHKMWWRFAPGTKVKVKWPVGWTDPVEIPAGSGAFVQKESADPNDHYRPWLSKHVGKQGWHWNWDFEDNDLAENLLTIKILITKRSYASLVGMMWR
jgi:hypothetical protein